MAINLDEQPTERVPEYRTWGQVALLNSWEAVWKDGAWQLFDPAIHPQKDRRERVELTIIPIDEMQARYNVELKTNRDNREWASVTFPSIKALTLPMGIKVTDVLNRFVLVVKKPNGRTYDKRDANNQPTGEKGNKSDLLFERIFASQDECVADYNGTAAPAEDFPPIAGDITGTPAPAPVAAGPSMDTLINFARTFVKAAVKAHPGDLAAITAEVKHQLEVKNSTFFAGKLAADSAEVLAMIAMEMG